MSKDLVVRCRSCGIEFPTPNQMDEKEFKSPFSLIKTNSYTCPKGHNHQYQKADHHFV